MHCKDCYHDQACDAILWTQALEALSETQRLLPECLENLNKL